LIPVRLNNKNDFGRQTGLTFYLLLRKSNREPDEDY